MSVSAQILSERLSPVREETVAALLQAQASAIEAGAEVDAEPIMRSPDGQVRRSGVLGLPARGDLAITTGERTIVPRIDVPDPAEFAPVVVFTNRYFTAEVAPFTWGRAVLNMKARVHDPNWTMLRLWFLEWFQSRPTPLAPELCGAVHSLDGPYSSQEGWRVIVDLGSAPLECVPALVAAVAQTGCASLTIGGE